MLPDAFEKALSSYIQTKNAMKDDDLRPKAPEGYTVMLGKDFTTEDVPIGTKAWSGARWSGGFLERQEASQMLPDMWYAVPDSKTDDKPEAPEGCTVMLGKDIQTETPRFMWLFSCEEWSDWSAEEYESAEADWWYAVPNDPACTVIRDRAEKETWNTDPKASQAIQKPQLQLIPPTLNDETAKALLRGLIKYGPWNWRENKVEMMTYLGAMKRHIDCLIEGEDIDPDTGAHHLGCIAAGCGIVLDARKHGTLVDNRPPKGQNAP
jgi:hypothetical protein